MRELFVVSLLAMAGCCTGPGSDSAHPFSEVRDLGGKPVNPFNGPSKNAQVFIFVGIDCPISNHYAPEIERLNRKYGQVRFWLVYPDRDATAAEIQAHLKDYSLTVPALRDPKHQLVRKAKVRVTPEAAVFVADGREVYHGRIDDRYVDFGKERPSAGRRDLDLVLDAVTTGRPVPVSRTTAIGCYLAD